MADQIFREEHEIFRRSCGIYGERGQAPSTSGARIAKSRGNMAEDGRAGIHRRPAGRKIRRGPGRFHLFGCPHRGDPPLGAWGLAAAIGVHNDITMPYIEMLGTEEQKMRWLPKCCTGEVIAAIGMTEPGAGSDLQAIRTVAVRDGDEYVIDGEKTFITNGYYCDLIVLAVKTDPRAQPPYKGVSLIVVEN